jgi:hypothetical protein
MMLDDFGLFQGRESLRFVLRKNSPTIVAGMGQPILIERAARKEFQMTFEGEGCFRENRDYLGAIAKVLIQIKSRTIIMPLLFGTRLPT